jgi:hypothetical protein
VIRRAGIIHTSFNLYFQIVVTLMWHAMHNTKIGESMVIDTSVAADYVDYSGSLTVNGRNVTAELLDLRERIDSLIDWLDNELGGAVSA